uniref:Uncharacterized protein LOC104246773 n=1 Tax=Nicotiana sylvestris TaxID=4096 RepID=A0A1U7YQ31_NICSY|nr:PREDICTED: uncharacterized protein LOC104246773 [Nicotiana sylvestris]
MEYFRLVHNHHKKVSYQNKTIQWQPPPNGFFKLNTDHAYDENSKAGGGGGLIRNHNGDWITGYTIYNYTHSSIHMEILAFYNGLRLALNHKLAPLIVEINSQVLSQLLSSNNLAFSHMLMDCRNLLEKLGSPQVGHIFREANAVADKLACYGKGRDP